MTSSPPPASARGSSGEGQETETPTPLDVAEAFEHAHPGTGLGEPLRPPSGRFPPPLPDDVAQGETAERIVAAVLAVPGVVRLHAGVFGEVATYLPGRAVTGVRLRPEETEVHLVVSTDRPIPAVARDVHESVRALTPGPVRVYVEDVESPPSSSSAL
ncbi:Asp23/Gls24 family envelope stress response protein [Oerskovia paurometabola]|uniref:hypothetical protein n=1 Tax=Oerskovia paurometabola TaxID=162170 RepID=UPI00382E6852